VMSKGFDAQRFLDIVERHRITSAFLVPTMIYVLLDHPSTRSADLSSLQLIIYGAAPMSPSRLIEGMKVFGPVFMQLYAQSEAPNTLTVLRQQDHDPENFPHRLASCGRPIFNSQVRLLDDDGREVPTGEVGEICVRGPLVMKGYWNKPEETARAFVDGWLATGDLAVVDAEGYVTIVDRAKDMILSGGENVYSTEVEHALASHPAVLECAAYGVPDERLGECVRAAVVLRPARAATQEELVEWVKARLARYKAPKAIDFLEALPRTGSGKIQKSALREPHWSGRARRVN